MIKKWSDLIVAFLVSVVTVGMILVMHPIQIPYQSGNQISYAHLGPNLENMVEMRQQFVPQYSDVEYISIFLGAAYEEGEEGQIHVTLYDENGEGILENSFPLTVIKEADYYTVMENLTLNPGHSYYLALKAIGVNTGFCTPTLYYSNAAACIEQTDCTLTYAMQPIEHAVAKMNFKYQIDLSKKYYLVYVVFLTFVIHLAISIVKTCKEKRMITD